MSSHPYLKVSTPPILDTPYSILCLHFCTFAQAVGRFALLHLLSCCNLHHILRQQIHAAEGRGEAAHGFLVREGDGLAGGDADVFLEVGDERDESDAVQGGVLAEEARGGVGLLQGGLAEFSSEGGETAKYEGKGLFAVKHESGDLGGERGDETFGEHRSGELFLA